MCLREMWHPDQTWLLKFSEEGQLNRINSFCSTLASKAIISLNFKDACERVGRQESPTNILISPSCFIRAGTFSILRYRTKLPTLTFPKKDILNHICYARSFTYNTTAFTFQHKNCNFFEGNFTSFLFDSQSWYWDLRASNINVRQIMLFLSLPNTIWVNWVWNSSSKTDFPQEPPFQI